MVSDEPPRPWRAPTTPVVVVRAFRPGVPYAAGGHRGIDLRARRGAAVGSPCAGVVTFRGRVAGGPPTVTVSCGALRATLQRVAPAVWVGQAVGPGAALGVATQAVVDLSARRADGSYVDPAHLIGGGGARVAPPVGRPAGRRGGGRSRPAKVVAAPARLSADALVSPHPGASAVAPRGRAGSTATGARPQLGQPRPPDRSELGPSLIGGGALLAALATGAAVVVLRARRRAGPGAGRPRVGGLARPVGARR